MTSLPFRQMLARPEPLLLGMNCVSGHPAMVEIMGYAGFDFVWFDMEHAPTDFHQVEHLALAADSAGLSVMVRVAENAPILISKALEAGATAVIVPHIETVDDLKRAVNSSLYAPSGERGACPTVRRNRYGLYGWADYVRQENEAVAIVPLLESPAAIERFDEFLSVPEVPAFFIGITDMSQALGLPGATFLNADLAERVRGMAERASAAGKVLMTTAAPLFGADYITHLSSIGFRAVSVGADLRIFANTLRDIRLSVGSARA